MAREILFRGICIKTKKWVYGGVVGLTEWDGCGFNIDGMKFDNAVIIGNVFDNQELVGV